jgi:hypothetical protein
MSAEVWYLDSSALVKTIMEQPESPTLMRWLDAKDGLVASEVVRVEAVQAACLRSQCSGPGRGRFGRLQR